MNIPIYIHTSSSICTIKHIYKDINTHRDKDIHSPLSPPTHTHTRTYKYTLKHTKTQIYAYTHTDTYVPTYIQTHTHTHIHKCTQIHSH